MSRGVSIPSNAQIVTYVDVSDIEDEAFDDYVESITDYLLHVFPSTSTSEHWLGREDKALVENKFCYIGMSVYCNVASIWAVPKPDYYTLAQSWIHSIRDKIFSLGNLTKLGTFSNGASVFEYRQKT